MSGLSDERRAELEAARCACGHVVMVHAGGAYGCRLCECMAPWHDALAPLIERWLAEERERIAQEIEAMESFAQGKNLTFEAHRVGYGTARRLAARIARGLA